MDKVIYLRRVQRRQVSGLHVKRLLRYAARENFHVAVAIFYIDEIERLKDRRELFREEFAVFFADAEDRHIAHVAEDRVARLFFYLAQELVRHGERKLIFACFGENARDGVGSDILELVNVEIERRIRGAGIICAGERRHKEFPDNDKAEQGRALLPETTPGAGDGANLFRVHHLAEFKRRLLLPDDRTDEIVRSAIIKLVGNIGHDILERRVATGLCRNLVPELVHNRVHALRELLAAELAVGEHACDIKNG